MKRKTLLFAMLVALLVPLAMNAQSTLSMTVYENETATNARIPLYGYNGDYYQKTEFVIPASELTALNGKTITQMAFYISGTAPTKVWGPFQVFLKEVDFTTISAWQGDSGATTVYTGTFDGTSGTVNVIFNGNTPTYTYNGGNLLVGVYLTTTSGNWNSANFYGKNVDGASGNGDNNNSLEGCTFTQRNFVPRTTFTYLTSDPSIALNPTSATVVTGFTQTLTASTFNVTGTPTITYTSSNTNVATVTGSGTSATVTGVAPGTATITATMTYEGNTYPATCEITVEDPSYCTPAPSNVDGDGISNVTFGMGDNIVNNDTPKATYTDYTSEIGAVQAGVESTIAITYAHTYTYGTFIWVDLNNDWDFEDEGEILYYGMSAGSVNPHTLNATIIIPATQTPGDYVMRIGGADSGFDSYSSANPCYTGSWACFQDYTLRVLEAPSCLTPTGLALATDGATATATWTGTTNTYNVEINGTPSPNNPITGTSHTFNVDLSTTYTVRVQANCDGGETSEWTDPVSVTTPDCIGGHTINYTLTDSYNDGWEGAYITVIEGCGDVVASLTVANGESPKTGTLTLCGDYYQFVYTQGNYPSEYGWTFTEGGSTIFSGAGNSSNDGQVLYTIGTQIAIPTALTEGTITKNSVELGWTENGTATAWQLCINGNESNPVAANTNPYTLGSLTPDTDYTIKVRAYIDATHQSCWSDEITVHTAIACARPESLTASNVTANSIDLSWTGNHEKYDVRYIETLPTADFEEGLGAWTTIDADGDGFTWLYSETGVQGHNGGSCAYSMSYDNDGGAVLYPDNYLVSPKVQLGGTISFYACNQDYRYPEYIGVAVSTTSNTNPAAFTNIFGETLSSTAKTQGDWIHITVDLSAYSGEGYVAIRHYNCSDAFYLDVDDITITVPETAAWNYKYNLTSNKCTLDNLAGNTTYAIQVRGYCQGETDPSNWCEAITATTVNGNIFQTAGEWNVAANWAGGEVPAAGSDVIIAANVTVPATYVADAGNITFENSAAITVAEGGQLKTTASGVNATMLKHIDAANNWSTASEGWNFIAYPVIGSGNPSTLGMIASEATQYDLYYFDLNCNGTYGDYGVIETEGTDNNEWRNYKQSTFTLNNGQGYLYANANDVDLSFTGELNPTNANIKVLMHYSANARFQGVNLLGNPYSCNAYIADGRDFYVLDADGKEVMKSTNSFIAPMQAVLVETTAIGNLNFTTTAPSKGRVLNMSLSNRNALVDNAAIRFDEGEGLSKFQLNPNHTKIYIEQDNKDYAVVHSAEQGEMPVSFKAEKNGNYTISFSTENVEFGYLHLIDNLTGNDVDLLATPSYSFEANTTDYASRFRLVFSAGNANDSQFAFISNGEIVLNGQGTAQVFDVTGRMIGSHNNVTRISTENMAAGVYMIRLINGTDVKTQKIVVK